MNKTRILLLLALLLLPILALAQDDEVAAMHSLVEELDARCPICQRDQWVINSVHAAGDTVVVEIVTPPSLASFLPMLTGDNPKAKKLWLRHLCDYGEDCERLVEFLAKESLPMRLSLKPRGSDAVHVVTVDANEVGTILASD